MLADFFDTMGTVVGVGQEAGLLDELTLMISPVVLGVGKRLFGDGTPAKTFKLIEHRVTAGGTAMATYEPAGNVETGSFAMPDPSPEELARAMQQADQRDQEEDPQAPARQADEDRLDRMRIELQGVQSRQRENRTRDDGA